jgi:BirA family biotin operon repressor/biotin-[acetyl-CoA-carboxylase] ligase
VGTRVRAQMPDGNDIVGRAMDVERDGRLVVLDDCAVTHRIDTADVVHLRAVED